MTTPKQKAEELYRIFYNKILGTTITEHVLKITVKECALIACDQIIANTETIQKQCLAGLSYKNNIKYWQEVKNELK